MLVQNGDIKQKGLDALRREVLKRARATRRRRGRLAEALVADDPTLIRVAALSVIEDTFGGKTGGNWSALRWHARQVLKFYSITVTTRIQIFWWRRVLKLNDFQIQDRFARLAGVDPEDLDCGCEGQSEMKLPKLSHRIRRSIRLWVLLKGSLLMSRRWK